VLGDADAAEDAAQSAFLVLARRAGSVRGEQLGAWLHGVAVRVALGLRRKRTVRIVHERRAAQLAVTEFGHADPEPDDRLDQALAKLPAVLRQAVVLCHLEGRTQQEAASIAGCAPGTLGWRSSEGIKRLRRLLGATTPAAAVALGALLASEAQAASAPVAFTVPAGATLAAGSAASLKLLSVLALTVAAVAVPVGVSLARGGSGASAPAGAPAVAPEPSDEPLAVIPGTDIPDFGAHPSIVSVADGPWSSPAVWSPARVPAAGDVVAVATAVAYDAASDAAIRTVAVRPGGALRVVQDHPTRLTVGTLLVREGGTLEIEASSTSGTGPACEVVLADGSFPTSDPQRYAGSLIGLGRVRIAGPPRAAMVRLAAEPHAGDTRLRLVVAAAGWKRGDTLLLVDSRQIDRDDRNPPPPQDETATIATLSDDAHEITLAAPLAFTHPGASDIAGTVDLLPHVVDLTRAVVVRSQRPDGRRGIAWFGNRASVDVRGCAFVDLGRLRAGAPETEPPRNAVRLVGLAGAPDAAAGAPAWIFSGNVVRSQLGGTYTGGIAVERCHFGELSGNVVDGWHGNGIATVDGTESANRIAGNVITRIIGTSSMGDRSGLAGYGIFLRGPDNQVVDNVVSRVVGGPYSFAYTIDAVYTSRRRIPARPGADPADPTGGVERDPNGTPLREFAGNEAYAVESGLRLAWLGTRYLTPLAEAGTLDRFSVWHHSAWALYCSETNGLTLDHFVARGDPAIRQPATGLYFLEVQRSLRIAHADLQMIGYGIGLAAGDRAEISDSFLRAEVGISEGVMGTANGGQGLPPRTVEVRNVRYADVPGHPAHVGIARALQGELRSLNPLQRDELVVRAYDGHAGDDFAVYFAEQRADAVLPQAVDGAIGAPEAGLTNAQAWSRHGIAFAGAIAPAAAAPREGIVGLVAPLAP
jgi:RNA polymerase sigma factor (sigma-70 family)